MRTRAVFDVPKLERNGENLRRRRVGKDYDGRIEDVVDRERLTENPRIYATLTSHLATVYSRGRVPSPTNGDLNRAVCSPALGGQVALVVTTTSFPYLVDSGTGQHCIEHNFRRSLAPCKTPSLWLCSLSFCHQSRQRSDFRPVRPQPPEGIEI